MDNINFKQLFFNGIKIQRIYRDGEQLFESVIRIPFPTVASVLTYNGKKQTVVFNNYNTKFFTVTGIEGTNAGTYTAVFQLKEGYGWDVKDDNTMYSSYKLNQTIGRQKTSAKPSISSTSLKYNGKTQNLTSIITNYDKNKMTLSGTTSSKNAGSFTAYVTPASNYCQPDGSTGKITLTQKINKISLAKPYLSGPAKTFAFDGKDRTWTVVNYNSTYMTQSGATTFKASSFANTANVTTTVKWTLKDSINYCWSDGTSTPATDSWTVKWVAVGSKNITGSTTFTVPNNVYQIKVFAVGGGGGVYSPYMGLRAVGLSGGAAGGYAVNKTIDVTPGEKLSIVVGAGGNGLTKGQDGGTGGTSGVYRGSTALVEAKGGGNANYQVRDPYTSNATVVDGADGGSGGGGSACTTYDEQDGGGGLGGYNGYDGGDAYQRQENHSEGTAGKFSRRAKGGKGQGTSTKAWGNTGLPYSKGASVGALCSNQGYEGTHRSKGQHGETWSNLMGRKDYDTESNSLSGPGSGSAGARWQYKDYQYSHRDAEVFNAGKYKATGETGIVLLKQGY